MGGKRHLLGGRSSLSELRAQTSLNSGHGHSLVPTISSRSGGVHSSGMDLPMLALSAHSQDSQASFQDRASASAGAPRGIHDYVPSPDS